MPNDGSQYVVDATVDSIRNEWRGCVMDMNLFGGMHALERHTEEAETAKRGFFVMVQFGVRAGLICPNEANDWLAVMRGEKSFAEVTVKWFPE